MDYEKGREKRRRRVRLIGRRNLSTSNNLRPAASDRSILAAAGHTAAVVIKSDPPSITMQRSAVRTH